MLRKVTPEIIPIHKTNMNVSDAIQSKQSK